MNQRYGKEEKLKQKKQIETLFGEGNTIGQYPVRLFYLRIDSENLEQFTRTGVSVSKRNFKNAVDRNRIKRLLREAYRLNKTAYFNNILDSYALMILYIGKDGTDFDSVETKMKQLLDAFSKKVS